MRSAFPTRPKTIARPPTIQGFPAMPTGPRAFSKRNHPGLVGGPGAPPKDFVLATTSGSEWILYWGMFRVLAPNNNPRKPPFVGSPAGEFVYQYNYSGGRHFLGGAVVDYVIDPYLYNNSILVRLQTEEFHIYTDDRKHAYDLLQARELGKYGEVYDIFGQQIIADKTGLAAIMAVKDCIAGRYEIDPLKSGQAKRVRVR